MHTASEVCVDSFQADRAPDRRYRTSPLNGLWTHAKGGFYHDGRFGTMLDVVTHYDNCHGLGLSDQDKSDVVEFLSRCLNRKGKRIKTANRRFRPIRVQIRCTTPRCSGG